MLLPKRVSRFVDFLETEIVEVWVPRTRCGICRALASRRCDVGYLIVKDAHRMGELIYRCAAQIVGAWVIVSTKSACESENVGAGKRIRWNEALRYLDRRKLSWWSLLLCGNSLIAWSFLRYGPRPRGPSTTREANLGRPGGLTSLQGAVEPRSARWRSDKPRTRLTYTERWIFGSKMGEGCGC